MMGLFRRKNKNLKPPERRIIFLMNDGSWKQHYRIEGEPRLTFNELIASTLNMYKERYVGAYDHYTFFSEDDTTIEIISKFSYEKVGDMWNSMGKPNSPWGINMSNDEEENKQIIIGSMLLSFRGEKTIGTGNMELDNKLTHDYVLISLARSGYIKNKKERLNALLATEGIMKIHSLPENEVENFNKIINSMKKA